MIHDLLRWFWMLAGWFELLLLTLLLYPLSFLPHPPGGYRWYRGLFRLRCRAWIDALGVELRLHQKNRHPVPNHYILVANHPSVLEDVGIPALLPVVSLAKAGVRRWPVMGRIAAAAGTLFVKRNSGSSRRAAKEGLKRALERGDNVAIYPEGGIHDKRLHHPFHYGAFDLSLRTGVPILPVYLHYEAQDDFHWGDEPLPRRLLSIMRSRNNQANYYRYDAFDPADFQDEESYCARVYEKFLEWQEKYLD